jgi:hypothetical protein
MRTTLQTHEGQSYIVLPYDIWDWKIRPVVSTVAFVILILGTAILSNVLVDFVEGPLDNLIGPFWSSFWWSDVIVAFIWLNMSLFYGEPTEPQKTPQS